MNPARPMDLGTALDVAKALQERIAEDVPGGCHLRSVRVAVVLRVDGEDVEKVYRWAMK